MQGATLTITFNSLLKSSPSPAANRFRLYFRTTVPLVKWVPTGTRVDGKTVVLTLPSAVAETDHMEFEYMSASCFDPGEPPCIQDLAGNVAPLIEIWRVTHGPPPPDGGPYPSRGRGLPNIRGTYEDIAEDPLVSPSGSAANGLAAIGHHTLTSVLDNIGPRVTAPVPSSGLTLAGETVTLAAPPAAGLADGERTCLAAGSGGRAGFAGDREGCASAAGSRSVEAGELLYGSAFSLTLGAPEGSGAPSSPLWSVWGRGDYGRFAGRPEPGTRYEGRLRTGWLGVDARAGPWVAGLAVSRGTGEADYGFDDGGAPGRGRSETALTALYPYGRWTLPGGLELSGVLGAGRGEARRSLNGRAPGTSRLSMRMGSVGLRHEFPRLAETRLAARGDASLVRMETGDGPGHADGLTADVWRARLGLEASRRFALDGETAFTPFVEAAGRRDGGDGLAGTGLEATGGLRYTAPRLHLEARGRWLAVHSEEGARESGASVTARVGPGAHGRGLSLALNPRWGAGTGGAEALWKDELPRPAGTRDGEAGAVDARAGWGFGLAPHGLLTPFAEIGLSGGDSRRLRLGARFEAPRMALGAEIAGERVESGAAEPGHTLRLGLQMRF